MTRVWIKPRLKQYLCNTESSSNHHVAIIVEVVGRGRNTTSENSFYLQCFYANFYSPKNIVTIPSVYFIFTAFIKHFSLFGIYIDILELMNVSESWSAWSKTGFFEDATFVVVVRFDIWWYHRCKCKHPWIHIKHL